VVFSYARSNDKLKKFARGANRKARPGTPHVAAQEADAVFLAAHWSRVADILGPFALLMAQLAYRGEGGSELAYRFEQFGK